MWNKFYKVYCRTEEAIVGFGFVAIIALTFMNAVLRIFKAPIVIADDTCLLLFSWVAFLGADVALRYSRLVGMDIVLKKFPPKVQKVLQILIFVIIIAILCIFINGDLAVIRVNSKRPFNTLPIPYSYVTLSLAVGSILMVFTSVIKIVKLILHFKDDSYTVKKDNPDKVGEEFTGAEDESALDSQIKG